MASIKKFCSAGSAAGVGALVRGILLFAVAGFGVSCATYEGAYSTYETKAVTNPSKDAILGMWHRTAKDSYTNTTWAALFKSGGVGHFYYYNDDAFEFGNWETTHPFTWRYLGKGVWSVEGFVGGWSNTEVRLADGVLLVKAGSLFGPVRQVYRKVKL